MWKILWQSFDPRFHLKKIFENSASDPGIWRANLSRPFWGGGGGGNHRPQAQRSENQPIIWLDVSQKLKMKNWTQNVSFKSTDS